MKRSLAYKSNKSSHKSKRRLISAEQITFAIASLIVAVLIGLIIYIWITEENQPPAFSIQQEAIRVENQQFYAPFKLKNTGGVTAESVQVLGELRQGDEVIEAGEQQFDFLSSGEEAEGAFVFSQDPRRKTLEIRVASYKLP